MEKIKVLHVLESFSINSGVSSVVMNYYKSMDHQKFKFDFLVNNSVMEKDYSKVLKKFDSNLYVLPKPSLYNVFTLMRAVNAFFAEHDYYDAVHVHVPNAAVFYLSAAKRAGIKVRIVHSHNSKGGDTFLKEVRNRLLFLGIPFVANYYMTCSDKAADYLFGKKSKDAILVYNAIDFDDFFYSERIREKTRDKLGLKKEQILVGHIGRFNRQKNHKYLLKIFKELTGTESQSKLILLGDGPQRKLIEKQACDIGIKDKVIFAGVKANVKDYLQAIDVFVLPSYFEGLPVVGVEAQATGLPCIFSKEITKQVVFSDVKSSFLDIFDNPKTWADEIIKLKLKKDRESSFESKFDIKIQATILEEHYEYMINQQNKP